MPDHYTRLLEWRREEAATRGLHKLPADFYSSTEAYLAETRATFESELRANPGGRKGDLARQTYIRAVQVARDIVDARTTKVLNLAFQASVGSAREVGNALAPERQLYDRLNEVLRNHRQRSSPYLEAGGAPAPPAALPPEAPASPSRGPAASTPVGGASRPAVAVVRIVKEGRPVEIGGETVDLRKEDVLTLPEETARLLVETKVAERVTPKPGPTTT